MLTTEKSNNTITVSPEGTITAANAESLRQELLELVQEGDCNLTINLNKVEMMDSKGLAIFVVCHKFLSERDKELTVVTDNEDFRELFHVMRLDQHFTVKAS